MKLLDDYSFIKGFNYTGSNGLHDADWWEHYDHALVDRDMGYAQRLGLNSARIFLTYQTYKTDPPGFLAKVKDFLQTAWRHGISTNPIIYHGFRFHPDDAVRRPFTQGVRPVPKTLTDPSCWEMGERYFDDLYAAIGDEPGLLFWDISNEPGFRTDVVNGMATRYPDEPEYLRARELPITEAELRERQELVWRIVRHFCRYVKAKDPATPIGVGNTFIYETEPSGTAELVDIIVFHDYFETRTRVRDMYEQALALGNKYGKPVINNETCCLCRANPYDMAIELCTEYKIGYYAFELMIGIDGWNRVHGIVYPDGTIRDPAAVAAIAGFFRNRGDSAIPTDVNQENHAYYAIENARKAILGLRRPMIPSRAPAPVSELLEACEYIANLLEGGQHVPMDFPPTARIAAYRRQQAPDAEEICRWLDELVETLKKACHIY